MQNSKGKIEGKGIYHFFQLCKDGEKAVFPTGKYQCIRNPFSLTEGSAFCLLMNQ